MRIGFKLELYHRPHIDGGRVIDQGRIAPHSGSGALVEVEAVAEAQRPLVEIDSRFADGHEELLSRIVAALAGAESENRPGAGGDCASLGDRGLAAILGASPLR